MKCTAMLTTDFNVRLVKNMHDVRKVTARTRIYLLRRSQKTLILAAVFWVLSVTGLCGMVIFHSVGASLKELREQFYGCVTVNAVGAGDDLLTPDLAELAADLTSADGWTGTTVCYLSVDEISLIPGQFTVSGNEAMHITKLYSCRDSTLVRDFTSQTLSLVQGRHLVPDDEGKVLISETLAEMNGLKLGGRITCTVTDDVTVHAAAGLGTQYEFEIVGTYRVEKDQTSSSVNRAECEILENAFYVDEATGFDIERNIWQKEQQYVNGVILWMRDPARLEDAVETLNRASEFAEGEYYVASNSAEYDRAADPMHHTEQILTIFLSVIVGIGSIFLIVILSMWNRERMPEIGILLSLGFTKKKILLQLLMENMCLFFTGFVLAVLVVLLGSGLIGNILSMEQISLEIADVFAVGIFGILLCGIITLLSAIYVMRKKPAEIVTVVL